MRRLESIFSLLVIWGLANSPVWASPQRDAVLGADGEIYIAKAGTYGELFPGGKAVDSSNPVLALELTRSDGSQERLLVEGTEGPDRDRLPFLLYEESSRTVFLLWETQINEVHPILILSGYNGSWIDPVEIVGNPFAPKTCPRFTITRDTLQEPGSDGALITRHRTMLHLVWGEEGPDGSTEAFYAPVIFDDGVLVARSKV